MSKESQSIPAPQEAAPSATQQPLAAPTATEATQTATAPAPSASEQLALPAANAETAPTSAASALPTAATESASTVSNQAEPKAEGSTHSTQTIDSARTDKHDASAAAPKSTRPKRRADTLLVEYSITARAGDEVIVDIASAFELPRGLQRDALANTDAACQTMFDLVVEQPFLLAIRGHLQKLFQAEGPEETPGPHSEEQSHCGEPKSSPGVSLIPPVVS